MIGAYLALFYVAGFLFIFASLLLGRFLRPKDPNTEKLEIYECGEPTIGSSYVQFDLRFYVVALLFIIFDVEVAFFFPWATVFGKTTNMASANVELVDTSKNPRDGQPKLVLSKPAADTFRELGIPESATSGYLAPKPEDVSRPIEARQRDAAMQIKSDSQKLALFSLADIGVFFAVLMVGFAYVWKRGDLDWVRTVSKPAAAPAPQAREPAMSR
jgi:NADH-quinone oxidoreductase subunit A